MLRPSPRRLLVLFLLTVTAVEPAMAGFELFTDPDVEGFVDDTATAPFLAAAGDPIVHTGFLFDAGGEPLPDDGAVAGDGLTRWATLSSPEGEMPELVLVNGSASGDGRAGPSPGFLGTLTIDFAAKGATATAVGFGPVGLGTSATIRFLDPDGAVLLETTDASNAGFTFVGITTSDDDLVARVVIEGAGVFAIQDLQYVVPEPGPAAQVVVALTVLGLLRSRGPACARSA